MNSATPLHAGRHGADRPVDIPMDTAAESAPRVMIWDAPVRVMHWLLAFTVIGAFITAESERWQLVHVTLGYTAGGVAVLRGLWGLVGTRYARFASFVRGPSAIWAYVRSMTTGRPEHHTGHNPAGALAMVGMLALTAFAALSGWMTYTDIGGNILEEVHEVLGNALIWLAGFHVLAAIVASLMHRENLVRAMFTGRKRAAPREAIRGTHRMLAAIILIATLGFWAYQWNTAPAGALPGMGSSAGQRSD